VTLTLPSGGYGEGSFGPSVHVSGREAMQIEAALAAIRRQPTLPNVLDTVHRVWRARFGNDADFDRRFNRFLSEVWCLSTCGDAELLALYTQAAGSRHWGLPVFATDEDVLSFHPYTVPDQQFLTETWTEIEWDGGRPGAVAAATMPGPGAWQGAAGVTPWMRVRT
jgi:hypothetical protein